MVWEIKHGDWIERLREMPSESVHCVVTSPPYWGLRDYGTKPQVFDAQPGCTHEWGNAIPIENGSGLHRMPTNQAGGTKTFQGKSNSRGCWCVLCGAWRGHLGLEPTPELYVKHMVAGFSELQRVLRKDGTCWMNLGDCYATGAGSVGECPGGGEQGERWKGYRGTRQSGKHEYISDALGPMVQPNRMPLPGLKPKDLVGMPWRVAFALQADGWYLRQEIIWSKPNPMPESVTDRCTKSHEYLFLLTKSAKYFFDHEAIKEPSSLDTHERRRLPGNKNHSAAELYEAGDEHHRTKGGLVAYAERQRAAATEPRSWHGSEFHTGKTAEHQLGRAGTNRRPKAWDEDMGSNRTLVSGYERKLAEPGSGTKNNSSFDEAMAVMPETRNRRSVWTINPYPFPEAHFATFPPKLVEPCILAGTSERGCCPKCGAPWKRITESYDTGKRQKMADGWDTGEGGHGTIHRDGRESGAGTTGLVALRYHRNFIGIELKADYVEMARRRIEQDAPLFNQPETTPA